MTGLGILNNTDPDAPQAPAAIVPLGTAAFALPLATNFLITISTVIRLYMLAAKARRINTTNALNTTPYVHKAAAIVIESGLIYLIAQLILVILFSIGHPAQNIVAVVACQIYVSSTIKYCTSRSLMQCIDDRVSRLPLSHSAWGWEQSPKTTSCPLRGVPVERPGGSPPVATGCLLATLASRSIQYRRLRPSH